MSKKRINTYAISNELEGGASLFFSKPSIPSPPIDKSATNLRETTETPRIETKKPENEIQDKPITQPHENLSGPANGVNEESHDVVTSLLNEVKLRDWKDIIENTETHSSSLRLTNEENYAIEDLINELKRSLKIKTSLNEVTRLGLLYIIYDFNINRDKSLVYKVKKS